PYNQGVIVGNMIYTSGQIPLDKDGVLVSDDIDKQAKQCLENISAILESAGSDKSKIVKTTIFLTDLSSFQKVNEVYAKYFENEQFPARTTVEVSKLPKDVKIEIEAIAYI
ncbi:MAG TPA: RidA family protein, partial [Spirochaetota bacterium]|nr:RidA family protein [Spirochaetota bacterium]